MLYPSQPFPASLRPAYGLTKNAGTMLLQQIVKDVAADELQIVSFHPGVIYNDEYPKAGIQKTDLPYDDGMLSPLGDEESCIDTASSRACRLLCSLGNDDGGQVPARSVCVGGLGYR